MDFKGIALGIDSATDHCSVALSVDGDCFSRSVDTPRDHSRALLPMVSDLLDEHQVALKEVDLLAYSQGPVFYRAQNRHRCDPGVGLWCFKAHPRYVHAIVSG